MTTFQTNIEKATKRITQRKNMNRDLESSRRVKEERKKAKIWTPADQVNRANAVTNRGNMFVNQQRNTMDHALGVDRNNLGWANAATDRQRSFAEAALKMNAQSLDIAKAAQSKVTTDPLTGEEIVTPGIPISDRGGIMIGGYEGPPVQTPMAVFANMDLSGGGRPDRGMLQQGGAAPGGFQRQPPVTSGNVKTARQLLSSSAGSVMGQDAMSPSVMGQNVMGQNTPWNTMRNRPVSNNIPEGVPLNVHGRPQVESKTVGDTTYITNTRDYDWGGFKDVPGLEPYRQGKQTAPKAEAPVKRIDFSKIKLVPSHDPKEVGKFADSIIARQKMKTAPSHDPKEVGKFADRMVSNNQRESVWRKESPEVRKLQSNLKTRQSAAQYLYKLQRDNPGITLKELRSKMRKFLES